MIELVLQISNYRRSLLLPLWLVLETYEVMNYGVPGEGIRVVHSSRHGRVFWRWKLRSNVSGCLHFDTRLPQKKSKELENLRASLVGEMRTSEGAKRLQHHFCGPGVALSFNFSVSVGIILMNKLILGKIGFNYPICLTLIHYMISWSFMAMLNAVTLLPVSPPAKSLPISSLLTLGIVISVSTGLANVSLKYNSVGFYQMAKIAVTPTIILSEFILFRKTVSLQKVLSLAVVSIGVAVATVSDLEFNFFGACVAVVWIIPSAINKILWSTLQQQNNWTALALMWKTNPIAVFFLAALTPLLDPPGVLSFDWSAAKTTTILLSGAFGFLLQLSSALALGATSATSHVVLGQFKTCVVLLGGSIFFHSSPGIPSICGAVAALAGMSAYSYVGLQDSRRSSPSASRPASTPLQKSRLHKEIGSTSSEGNSTTDIV